MSKFLNKLWLALPLLAMLQAVPPATDVGRVVNPITAAEASYVFDGTNDQLRGTLTTQLNAYPMTLACRIKYTTHPVATQMALNVGISNASINDSQRLRTSSTDDAFQGSSTDSGGTQAAASKTEGAAQFDGVWVPLVAVFTSTTLRDIYVNVPADTGTNTTSKTLANTNDDIAIGENLVDGEDFNGRIADCALWKSALSAGNIAAYLDNTDGITTDEIDASNLSGYWPLLTSSLNNDGTDAGGDLTASGNAASDTDNPPPEYTSVAAGTITVTTIPTTFTVNQTGTVYGVACPDGQAAPTVAQVKAGNCTGNIAAVSSWSEAVVSQVADGHTFTGLVAGTRYDLSFAAAGTSQDIAAIFALANQDTTAVSFSVNPSCSAATNGVSCTYTATATSTAYGVGVNPGDGTPTCTQIKAGQNDGGTAALWAGSDANTGTSDTITVTGTNKPIRMNLHFCVTAGSTDSSVYSGQTDKDRSPKAGFAIVTLTSLSATGIADCATCFAGGTSADAYFTPDVAIGDGFEYEDDTNESADCNISISAAGELTYTPVAPTDCDGKQTFEISYQDVSSATDGLFNHGTFATDDLICKGNVASDVGDPFDDPIVLLEDAPMDTLAMSALFSDPDGGTHTYAVTSGTLPPGTSLNASTGDITGTPNTENEAGVSLSVTQTDECGATAVFSFDLYVVNTWVVPNIVGNTLVEASAEVIAAAPWRVNNVGISVTSFVCGSGQPAGNILTQDPAAAASAGAQDSIDVTVAASCVETWVSYSRVWMFREVRKVYLTTTAFKDAVEDDLRAAQSWTRWRPGTQQWSGSSNMEIDVLVIPGVPPLRSDGVPLP